MVKPVTDAPAISAPATKKIMLVVPHVFLPLDPVANDYTSPATETKKYEGKDDLGKRVRMTVSAALADFLASRDQAEILD